MHMNTVQYHKYMRYQYSPVPFVRACVNSDDFPYASLAQTTSSLSLYLYVHKHIYIYLSDNIRQPDSRQYLAGGNLHCSKAAGMSPRAHAGRPSLSTRGLCGQILHSGHTCAPDPSQAPRHRHSTSGLVLHIELQQFSTIANQA